MLPSRIVTTALAVAAALLVSSSTALAVPTVDGHFPVPEFGTNNKIVAGPDGNIWMTVSEGEKDVARITPAGAVEAFELEEINNPIGIAPGPEGKLWVTAINKVASFSPSDPKGTSQTFEINTVTSNNPIVAGPDGQMWVAASNNVVHFSPANPEGTATAIAVEELDPRDIDVAGSLLAIADTGKSRIVTMTTGGAEQDISIGHEKEGKFEGASQGLAGSPSGQIGFSQPGAAPEQIGLVTPPNPAQAFDRDGDPFGVAYGSDDAFWIALSGSTAANTGVERLTSTGEHTFLGGTPEGFTPRQIAAGPDNTIWVTVEKPGTAWEVVRISGLEPPAIPISGTAKPKAPETKISKGPKKTVKTKGKKAKVTFKFSSSAAGAKFECALVTLKKGKGKKTPKPKFKACKSPKKYKLKPGKYRFSVRAVLDGVADPSPATSTFKVVHVKH
jgi:streptogramin lyase